MSDLSVEQVAALIAAKSVTDDLVLVAVVEQIVTEARAAALSEAAKRIETARTRHWQTHLRDHPFADATSCPNDYGKHDAYYDAARIVRNLANSPPP